MEPNREQLYAVEIVLRHAEEAVDQPRRARQAASDVRQRAVLLRPQVQLRRTAALKNREG